MCTKVNAEDPGKSELWKPQGGEGVTGRSHARAQRGPLCPDCHTASPGESEKVGAMSPPPLASFT